MTIDIINKRELNAIKNFWAGFVVYTLAFTLSMSQSVSFPLCQVFQVVGLLLIAVSTPYLLNFKMEDGFLKIIMKIYAIWVLTIIFRGVEWNYSRLKEIMFNAWFGVLLHFVPLVLFFPRKIAFYQKTFYTIIILALAYLFFSFIFINALMIRDLSDLRSQDIVEYFSKTLSIPCGFILLTYSYHSYKTRLFALCLLLITLFFGIVRARRGLVFMTLSPLILSFFLFLSNLKGNAIKFFLFLIIAIAGSIFCLQVFNKNNNIFLSAFSQRIEEDTRSGVEECFYADMTTSDWLFGKGLDGDYLCPGIDSPISVYRTTIETDYLQIILKGGIVSLVLLLLIAVPAMLKGFFLSKNLFSKAAACWILLWIFELYPATVTTFTLNYILVWISVGICYSTEIRNMPEARLVKYFKLPVTI